MMVKSYLTGGVPRERMKDVLLEDHLECICDGCEEEECQGPVFQDRDDEASCCDSGYVLNILIGISLGTSLSCVVFLTFLVNYYRTKLANALAELKKIDF